MFNERMTGPELRQEYEKDLPEVSDAILKFSDSEYMKRYLWKHRKEDVVVYTKLFTSSRYNRYIGVLIHTKSGSKRNRSWQFSPFHVGLMETKKGLCAVAIYEENQQAVRFTPHFFGRYKERLSSVSDWRTRAQLRASSTLKSLMATFVQRNTHIAWVETESVYNNKVHIFGTVNDGVVLLEWDKERDMLQANTFVTFDMLDEKQEVMAWMADIYQQLPSEKKKLFNPPDFVRNPDT